MRWLAILIVLCATGSAWAQEDAPVQFEETPQEVKAYEQAIRRYNTNTVSFDTWADFKTAVLSRLSSGAAGTCYAQASGSMQAVTVTRVRFQPVQDDGWQRTHGNGWRKTGANRTFVEYRFNKKASVLLRIEGVKPRFFFARTERICEFPLR